MSYDNLIVKIYNNFGTTEFLASLAKCRFNTAILGIDVKINLI